MKDVWTSIKSFKLWLWHLAFAATFIILSACTAIAPQTFSPSGEPLPTSQPRQRVSETLNVERVGSFEQDQLPNDAIGFGDSIGLFGDTLVIGASNWVIGAGMQNGRAYVYQRQGKEWALQVLAPSDLNDGFQYDTHFGRAVAIHGDTVVVGAPKADDIDAGDNTGAVYIFERRSDSWEETAILKASDVRANAEFGRFLVLEGYTLAVVNVVDSPAVYIFQRQEGAWIEQARLPLGNSRGERMHVFDMDLQGDELVFSAMIYPKEGGEHTDGGLYFYRRSGGEWRQVDQWRNERPNNYPSSVSLNGDDLAVISDNRDSTGLMGNSVILYRRQGQDWVQQSEILLPDFGSDSTVSSSVAIQGDMLIVGVGSDSTKSMWAGAVYVFQRRGDEWLEQVKLLPQDGDESFGNFFGGQIAIDGDLILVSAPSEFGHGAYAYEIRR